MDKQNFGPDHRLRASRCTVQATHCKGGMGRESDSVPNASSHMHLTKTTWCGTAKKKNTRYARGGSPDATLSVLSDAALRASTSKSRFVKRGSLGNASGCPYLTDVAVALAEGKCLSAK